MMGPDQPYPRKVAFLRGARFATSIGDTDWRVGLAMPQFGFETWILGQGPVAPPAPLGVHLVPVIAPHHRILGTLALSLAYARLVYRLAPDAVVCNPGVAPAGILVKRLRPHTKLILDIRSTPVESRGVAGALWRGFFHRVLRWESYDGVTVISAGLLQRLNRTHRLADRFPVAVWGSGYDPRLFTPTMDGSAARRRLGVDGRLLLVYHGTLSATRGLDRVIRSLSVLDAARRNAVAVVFIGAGEAKPRLMVLADQLDVTSAVRFIGPVPYVEIPSYLAAADLGIVPLPDHQWWRHQSPIKLIECLAMGKPVIATDLPCHRGISDAVLLVPDNDPAVLARAVESALALPSEERRRLSAAAVADARPHTWEAKAGLLALFLREVLGG